MSPSTCAVTSRRVLLCGYYGEHNLGDDALLQVLLSMLPAGWEPLVTAHDQSELRDRHGLETVDRRSLWAVLQALGRCRALVLGGGSLLQDATSFRSLLYYGALMLAARCQGKPIVLWGQGLGPLRRRRSRLLARLLLTLPSAISWRDGASAALASRWGVAGEQGSDPVWALQPLSWDGRGGPIVVCWRPVATLAIDGWRPWLHALDQLAAGLNRPVLWLPFHRDQDRDLLRWLESHTLLPEDLRRRSRLLEVRDPAEALGQFRAASLVIAMRLHGLILAALAGSPCAALSYDPKVSAAAAALGCPCLDLAEPPPARLALDWRALVDRPVDPSQRERLRQQTGVHRTLLAGLDRLRTRSLMGNAARTGAVQSASQRS